MCDMHRALGDLHRAVDDSYVQAVCSILDAFLVFSNYISA